MSSGVFTAGLIGMQCAGQGEDPLHSAGNICCQTIKKLHIIDLALAKILAMFLISVKLFYSYDVYEKS